MSGEVTEFTYLDYFNHISELTDSKCKISNIDQLLKLETIDEMLKVRTAFTLGQTALKFQMSKLDQKTKWNEIFQIDFVKAS